MFNVQFSKFFSEQEQLGGEGGGGGEGWYRYLTILIMNGQFKVTHRPTFKVTHRPTTA